MEFQAQEIPRWIINKTQTQIMCTWRNAKMGSHLLGKLFSSGNWIRVRSLLAMTSLHEFTSKSIDFVLSFTQDDLDMYFFMDLPLGMGVGGNRGEWFLKLKINFMDSIKKLKIGLIF